MCIISIKSDSARKWMFEEIADMMEKNPDGAGFMYFDRVANNVKIEKGFFSPTKAFNYLKKLPDNVPIIFHARIATHGKVTQGNCHPFPLYLLNTEEYIEEKDLTKARQSVSVGLAHNGILKINPEGELSDTGTFCKFVNNHFDVAQLPYLFELLEGSNILNGSRLAILDSNGKVYKFGKWFESKGLYYSNWGYPNRWEDIKTIGYRPTYSKTPTGGKVCNDDVWNYPMYYTGLWDD